jgi:hypothetical protein
MKNIVDAVLYLNEFDLFVSRILWMNQTKLVAKHVVLESNMTYSGRIRQYELKSKLKDLDLEGKVEVLELDLTEIEGTWEKEIYSRERLLGHCITQESNSKFIFSDIDEIPSHDQIRNFYMQNSKQNFSFETPTYFRRINWKVRRMEELASGLMLQNIQEVLPNAGRHSDLPRIPARVKGVHFSYMYSTPPPND